MATLIPVTRRLELLPAPPANRPPQRPPVSPMPAPAPPAHQKGRWF